MEFHHSSSWMSLTVFWFSFYILISTHANVINTKWERMDDARREMKLELYNFLPRPDPGVAHRPGQCLPRPVARPTFTSTILLPPPPSHLPPLQTSTWSLSWPHTVLTAELHTVHMNSWKQDWAQQGPRWCRNSGTCRSCFVGGSLHLGSDLARSCMQGGDWSQTQAPPRHKLQVQWTAAPNFATISRMQFEEFLKFSFLRSCGPAPSCNVTPGRG